MAMFYALVVVCLFGSALAQVPSNGPCPRVRPMQNFDSTRYVGKWYEAERFFAVFQINSKCNYYDYTLMKNGSIDTEVFHIDRPTNKVEKFNRPLYLIDSERPAERLVQIPYLPPNDYSNFYILETDYENYAVCWVCDIYDSKNIQFAYLLTRERHPSKSVLAQAYRVFDRNGLKRSNLLKSDQRNCPRDGKN